MNRLLQIALTKIKGIGPKNARNLLAHCGSMEEIFKAKKKQLLAIPNIGQVTVDAILSKEYLQQAEEELYFIEKNNIQLRWITDDDYPRRLLQCEDAPLLLYYKGSVDLNPKHCISIVGTRNATAYGRKIGDELVKTLSHLAGTQIISGLAYGIDIHAHRLALKHHIPTIGILGHGFDQLYPAAHKSTAEEMIEHGGLITEFSSQTKLDRTNFPTRNRIIAGLSDVTVVIEAAKKGGALITAEIANSYNRDVCAFPGAIDQTYSAGCNYLIKTHRAHLIQNGEDLIQLMGWAQRPRPGGGKQLNLLPPQLRPEEKMIHQFLEDKKQAGIDEIALQLNWPMSKLASTLLEMEINEYIIALPGKQYKNLL